MTNYQTYRWLPALAGICPMEEAMKPGLAVEGCVRRRRRHDYAWKRLQELFPARRTAERVYEWKMACSLRAHYCAERVSARRTRVSEMREPPLGLDQVPDEK